MKKLLENKKVLKNDFKSGNAITLIALIITVIVMLILAGVAISAVLDQDGLFSKTQYAADEFNRQAALEKFNLKMTNFDLGLALDTGRVATINDLGKLIDENDTYYDREITEVAVANDNNSATVKMDGYTFTVDKNLNVTHIDGSLAVTKPGTSSGGSTGDNDSNPGGDGGSDSSGDTDTGNGDEPEQLPAQPTVTPGTASDITVKLATGMVPVVYNETDTSWYVATEEQITNNTWFEYVDTSIEGNTNKSNWANVMLMDNLKVDNNGTTVTITNTTPTTDYYGKKVTSEGSMYVWIPRYAYKITNGYHTNTTTGTIDVKFLNTNNTYKDGSSTSTILANPLVGADINSSTTYKVHPAFTWAKEDGTPVELEGLWIGKFEASGANASFAVTDPGNVATSSTVILRSVGNVSSWRSINRNNIFSNCYNMNSETNASIYGISTDKDEIDPHLIKNTEWGAAAYLAHSQYGRNGVEVTGNLSGYNTGNGAYKTNVTMSTTGNVYGIYDMVGGAWEHVAAYINNNNNNLTANGASLVAANLAAKYRDVYDIGVTDDYQLNYARTAERYGDALFETSGAAGYWNGSSNVGYHTHGWNGDHSKFPSSSYPFFYRGGYYNLGSITGVFAFNYSTGAADALHGFRSVLATM